MVNLQRITFSRLRTLAIENGVTLVAAVTRNQLTSDLASHLQALERWQEQGFAGEMGYMNRPSASFDVNVSLPQFQSIISIGIPYYRGEFPPAPAGYGRIARYAWGRDYHRVVKRLLRPFISALAAELQSVRALDWRLYTDAAPLLERAIASIGSMGFIGKNTMLIRPGTGSYFFLAEIICDVRVEHDETGESAPLTKGRCGACVRCIERCPTGAIVSPGVLDGRRCISYLTIEKRTSFNEWEAAALGDWIFGCDVCQEVCPFNHQDVQVDDRSPFGGDGSVGPYLKLKEVFELQDKQQFERRFAGTPLMRAKREGLIRNAACVAANTGFTAAISDLLSLFRNDPSAMVREQARASLAALAHYAIGFEHRQIKAILGSTENMV